MNQYMQAAITEALVGIKKCHGGPFGAVITQRGKIIARAHNEVLKNHCSNDHAEMLVIKRASEKLKNHDLSSCELYTTCEPCPMCLAAIMWARIKKVYYGCDRKDAARIGFDDAAFYRALQDQELLEALLRTRQLARAKCLALFKAYAALDQKTLY